MMYLPSKQREPELNYCRMVTFGLFSLGILIFLIYSNSFHATWHFDDYPNIFDNQKLHMTEISWHSIKSAIYSDTNRPNMPYRPVACLSFALNYFFDGLNVFWYHVVNVLIHAISSLFLFLFIYRTLMLPTLREKYASNAYFISLLATAFWAINPIQTQAITYIVQRMASLAAMFYIMGMYFYLRARTHERKTGGLVFLILCLFSFLFALGSKENAAMFPVSLFLYEMLIFQENSRDFIRKNLATMTLAVCGTLCIGFLYFYIQKGSVFSFLGGYEHRAFTLAQRLLTEPRIVFYYLSLIFYPMPDRLSVAYDFPMSTSIIHPLSTLFAILGMVAMIVAAFWFSKRWRLAAFAIIFFFLNHVIESSVFPLEFVFEHRNYLPSMFLFVPIAMGIRRLLQIFEGKNFMKFVICSSVILVMVGFGHSSFVRNFTWRNNKSLWIDAVDKYPNLFRPRHNLAKYYQDHGQFDKAISEYQIALKTKATIDHNQDYVAYFNLGKLYYDKKDYKKALFYYEKSLRLNSGFPAAYNNLAAVMTANGKFDLASHYLQEALELNPIQEDANYNLALLYLRWKEPDRAILHLKKAMSSADYNNIVLDQFGTAYQQKGEMGRAARYFFKSLEKNPRNLWGHLHLAEIFSAKGILKRSEKEIDLSLHLIPDLKAFHSILDQISGADNAVFTGLDPAITLKLLLQGCKRRSSVLKGWSEDILKTKKRLEKKREDSKQS
jgi:protein O-mannosyl-transferase